MHCGRQQPRRLLNYANYGAQRRQSVVLLPFMLNIFTGSTKGCFNQLSTLFTHAVQSFKNVVGGLHSKTQRGLTELKFGQFVDFWYSGGK